MIFCLTPKPLTLANLFSVKLNVQYIIIGSFLATPCVILQAYFFEHVMLSQAKIKTLLAIWLFFVFLRMIAVNSRYLFIQIFGFIVFTWFIATNCCSILILSSPYVGFWNAFKAFLYNYSLIFAIVPFFYLLKHEQSKYEEYGIFLGKIVFGIAIFSATFGIMQAIFNDYIIPESTIAKLVQGDFVKFDNLSGITRVSSIFKSPLEFGIYNSFFSCLCLYVYNAKRRSRYILLAILFCLATILTLSRTAILICGFSSLCAFYVINADRIRNYFISTLFGTFLILSLFFMILSFIDNDFIKVALSPTNFIIRLHNWLDLLNKFGNSPISIAAGDGIVQNGSYGIYHGVVIDNLYLGTLLTGGLLGFFLFVLCILISFRCYFVYQRHNLITKSYLNKACLTFALAFLVGGITENLMHLMYMLYFSLILPFIISVDRQPLNDQYC